MTVDMVLKKTQQRALFKGNCCLILFLSSTKQSCPVNMATDTPMEEVEVSNTSIQESSQNTLYNNSNFQRMSFACQPMK